MPTCMFLSLEGLVGKLPHSRWQCRSCSLCKFSLRRVCAAQVLSKPDVGKFVAAAHLLAAPGGTFFGSTAGADEAGADRSGVLA